MSFDICFDKECSSLMIRNIDELWFTPSDVVYDVEPYNGIFKRTSVNMDVVFQLMILKTMRILIQMYLSMN